jgi:polysaccharide pyruvyl transferase WcaK-like protein
MSSVFIVADIGLDQGNIYHVGDEAMFLANYNKYLSKGYNVFASSRSISHPKLQLTESLDIYIKSWIQFWCLLLASFTLRYFKLNLFPDFFRPTIKHLSESDIFHVSGGGNLVELWPGHIFYRCLMIITAWMYNKKIVVTGQSIHFIQNYFLRTLLVFSLNKVNFLSVRDGVESTHNLQAMNYPTEKVTVDLDDAYSWAKTSPKVIQKESLKIGLSFHQWGLLGTEQELISILQTIISIQKNVHLYLIPHVFGEAGGDNEFMLKIVDQCLQPNQVTHFSYDQLVNDLDQLEPAQHIDLITASMDLVISTRYHGLVFALANNVPALSLNYDSYYRHKNNGLLMSIFGDHTKFSLDIDRKNDTLTNRILADFIKNKNITKSVLQNYNIRNSI